MTSPTREERMGRFTIATYNVNSIRSRLHLIIPWLERNHPTLLCMQETKVEDAQFPKKEFAAAGYHVAFKGEKRYNGVAIASLEKPEDLSFGLDDKGPADGDRLIRGVFSGIPVVNTYVPQGYDREDSRFRYKLEWFGRLKEFFSRHYSPQKPLIWCGDLNVAPEEIDVHNPKRILGHVCFNPEVWKAFGLVTSWGFVDVFRKHHAGETGQYTFYDYRVPKAVERGLGWRVDHILATPALADRSIRCFIDMRSRRADKASDHTVVIAEFEV
jgi:exodeoxyribonuclease-3